MTIPPEIEKWIEETWPIYKPDGYTTDCDNHTLREGARAAIIKMMPLVEACEDIHTNCGVDGNWKYMYKKITEALAQVLGKEGS